MFTVDAALEQRLREIRRALHRRPELSYQEEQTAALICRELDRLGISYTSGLAGTGIRAEIGVGPGPCVALRADMDALPVAEETGLEFASVNPGVMHACGHDGHTTMLLGAAELLAENGLPEKTGGRVVLLFQPAEEAGSGAAAMIADNCLAGVDMIFGGHIDTHYPPGYLVIDQGLICSYADPFTVDICGQGGHAARPHEAVDAVVVGASFVINLQTMVARMMNPVHPGIVTVGRFAAGSVHNVIAGSAALEGTVRSTHPDTREMILSRMQGLVRGLEEMYHADITMTPRDALPAVVNDAVSCSLAGEAAHAVVGPERVTSQGFPSLGGEDFAFYQQHIPGTMIRFGAASDRETGPSHSGSFDFDEQVLSCGSRWLATVAVHALQHLQTSAES
ncbi:MAG: M20 metallopeptidase family protein [Candidatus Electrothrix sp. YB6]